jgi:hypothetical protein
VLDNSNVIIVPAGTCELAMTVQLVPLPEIVDAPFAPAAVIVQAPPIAVPVLQPELPVAELEGTAV